MRVNERILIIGAPGEGKTYFTQDLLHKQALQNVIIIDDIDHPDYANYPIYPVEMLPRWRPQPKPDGGKNIIRLRLDDAITDYVESFDIIAANAHNCLLIFEDATKYMSIKTIPFVKKLLANSKQSNVDIYLLFHSIGFVLPTITRFISGVVLFKTRDSLSDLRDKLGKTDRVNQAYNTLQTAQKYHYEYIKY